MLGFAGSRANKASAILTALDQSLATIQFTQQNAAMVEETTAASQSLAGETVELAKLIGQFQLGDRRVPNAPPARSAPPRQEKRAGSAPVKQLRVVGRGGAARKPDAAAAASDWEEF